MELDANSNLIQRVKRLTPGTNYKLLVEYAKRVGREASKNSFTVYWNGKVVKTIAPTETDDKKQFIATVVPDADKAELELAGDGNYDGEGILINRIVLTNCDDPSKVKE